MDKQLFSTEFKNGYCVTVFSQSRFELKYYVEVFHVNEPQDTHRVEFHTAREVFGYLSDIQNYKQKNGIEDLKKVKVYVDQLIKLEEKQNEI